MLAALWIATLLTIPTIGGDFSAGYTWSAAANACTILVTAGVLIALHLRPRWFAVFITLLLATVFVVQLIQTALFGGLFGSSLDVVFGLSIPLAALLVFGLRAALWCFAAYVASIAYAVAITGRISPVYVRPDASTEAGCNLIATGIVALAVMVYFVRQRDRFQQRGDGDLPSRVQGHQRLS